MKSARLPSSQLYLLRLLVLDVDGLSMQPLCSKAVRQRWIFAFAISMRAESFGESLSLPEVAVVAIPMAGALLEQSAARAMYFNSIRARRVLASKSSERWGQDRRAISGKRYRLLWCAHQLAAISMPAINCSNELVGLVDLKDLKLFLRVCRNSEMSLSLNGQDARLTSLVLQHGTDSAFQKGRPLLGWAEVDAFRATSKFYPICFDSIMIQI